MDMKHEGNKRGGADRGMPVTRRIVRDLQMQIESGRLSGGMKLPSIRELAEQYQISTAVTLAAYRELESRGFVERRAGSGTFVAGKGQNPGNSFFNWGNVLPVLETEEFLKEVAPEVAFFSFPATEYSYSPHYMEWLNSRNSDGEMNPGFGAVNDGQLACLARKGTLLPLDEFLDNSAVLRRECFPETLLRGMSWNGKLYALPVIFRPTLFFFNRRIFREAGIPEPDRNWSWQDLFERTRLLTRQENGRVSRYGLAVLFVLNTYASFVFQNNGELFDHNGNCVINSDRAYEALNFFSELFMLPGCCSHHHFGETRVSLVELLNNDLAAMLIGDAVDYFLLRERMPAGDWGMVRLPGRNNHMAGLSIRGIGLTAGGRAGERFRMLEKFFSSERYPDYCRRLLGFAGYGSAGVELPEPILEILPETSPSRGSSSPNASNALQETIEVVFEHRLPLTRKQCAEFERRINRRL